MVCLKSNYTQSFKYDIKKKKRKMRKKRKKKEEKEEKEKEEKEEKKKKKMYSFFSIFSKKTKCGLRPLIAQQPYMPYTNLKDN